MSTRRACNHKEPVVDVAEVWPEARTYIGGFMTNRWCIVCGAIWMDREGASAFGFDSAIWVRPTGEVTP